MESEIIKVALSQGLWAVLFIWLLFYVLKENSKREGELRNIIDKLTDKFNILENVQTDVEEIKELIRK